MSCVTLWDICVCSYCCYLFFQLRTHVDYFTGEANEDEPALSLAGALGLLGVITVIVAVASEYLTGAIEAVSKSSGLNQAFLGLIVLPIAGNACEHITGGPGRYREGWNSFQQPALSGVFWEVTCLD